jgi:hypothetical protein
MCEKAHEKKENRRRKGGGKKGELKNNMTGKEDKEDARVVE